MFEKIDASPKKYVVLDVETNGLSGKNDDLLSISIYKPDDGKSYDRFLPLELAKNVFTTQYNGIRKKDLKGKKPLSQEEVDELFEKFELSNRTILHYGSLDERFIKAYFKRHNLRGYECMRFYNFKKLICSSPFANGSITKDNLCGMFGIEGVHEIHSGMNDCLLEWKLFEKIGGRYLLATNTDFGRIAIFVLNPGYIIPVTYLRYSNLDKLVERPEINCQTEEVYRLKIKDRKIKRFPTNFSGETIEHLINTMLEVETVDSLPFLIENKKKLEYIGTIGSNSIPVPMEFNPDGTITAIRPEDKKLEKEINDVNIRLKKSIAPIVDYIREEIFHGTKILSQDITINREANVMAVCDLSCQDAVLEIKTSTINMDYYKEQLYYEAAGRTSYIMGMDWYKDADSVEFYILKVQFSTSKRMHASKSAAQKRWEKRLAPLGIELTDYNGYDAPLGLKCKKCGLEWTASVKKIQGHNFGCPGCEPKATNAFCRAENTPKPVEYKTPEELRKERADAYSLRIRTISDGKIVVCEGSYIGSKATVKAKCNECGYEWVTRADHLLSRCWCPICRKKN